MELLLGVVVQARPYNLVAKADIQILLLARLFKTPKSFNL